MEELEEYNKATEADDTAHRLASSVSRKEDHHIENQTIILEIAQHDRR